MAATDVLDPVGIDTEPVLDPLIDTYIRLAPGMQVRMHRCSGDVPMMDFVYGRSVLVVGFEAAEVLDLDVEHLVLAEEFASAACALRDEVRALLALRDAMG